MWREDCASIHNNKAMFLKVIEEKRYTGEKTLTLDFHEECCSGLNFSVRTSQESPYLLNGCEDGKLIAMLEYLF